MYANKFQFNPTLKQECAEKTHTSELDEKKIR